MVNATDFFAFSFLSSAMMLLRVWHSDSVCPSLSQYSHLGLALFFALTASCCSLVILSHSSLGMVFIFLVLRITAKVACEEGLEVVGYGACGRFTMSELV